MAGPKTHMAPTQRADAMAKPANKPGKAGYLLPHRVTPLATVLASSRDWKV